MLGLVVPDITNPFFAELAQAVEAAAAERGFLVTLGSSGSRDDLERELVADLAGRNVDGLLVSTVLTPEALAALPAPRRPTVLVNVSTPFAGYAALGSDSRRGAYDLVEHLLDAHGHTSVALVIGESTERLPEPRERGFADAFAAHGLPPGPVVRTDFSRHRRLRGHPAGPGLAAPARPRSSCRRTSRPPAPTARSARRGSSAPTTSRSSPTTARRSRSSRWPPLTVSRQQIEAHGPGRALGRSLDPARAPDLPAVPHRARGPPFLRLLRS